MYGVVTRNAEETDGPGFDLAFYEVKDVTGRTTTPIESAVNMVSCFGDTATATDQPDLIPVSETGDLATRDQPYFDWGYICPSHPDYADQLLDTIDACAAVNDSVRLDDVGFPRAEYCHCETCQHRFTDNPIEDWRAWRAHVITDFVTAAADRIPGRTYLTLYPDPYPGHLYRRAGIDIPALTRVVDEFVVPLYDMAYTTTYWLEAIATGFVDLLDHPFTIELYAINVDHENLVHAATVAQAYATNVLFAYDADTARDVIDALRDPQGSTPPA